MEYFLAVTMVVMLVFGFIAAVIADQKGISYYGSWLLGFLLGPIGIAIILLMDGKGEESQPSEHGAQVPAAGTATEVTYLKCGKCAEFVAVGSRFCQGCGAKIG